MELQLKNLSDKDIKSTGKAKVIKMRMSDDAQSFIFQMFTDDIYKNPVGSIVREITSNCFDSHVEAGNESPENPVMVKHTYDHNAQEHYISFVDKGVGMSPDRIENIYGVYFESTKRGGNDQIGGFGIGGKSPLSYTDSFTVITRFNGIEYGYIIYKGKEAPAIEELYQKTTKEVNGTEVRIPIKESDLDKFTREIRRQLYYFENIIFLGFDNDEELNNYNVYKGEHFLYRGGQYENSIHVCLGKVAYKIDYSDCGLNEYDYSFPLALKFDIGDIKVTPNRESLSYKDITIQMINDKIELVKKELGEMLSKQYNNVRTLKEYYAAKENFGKLTFSDNDLLELKNMFKKKDIKYTNFKYNDLPFIPTSDSALELLYNVHEYGKTSRWKKGINVTMINIGDYSRDKIYQSTGEFKRKIIKQSYLNSIHNKNFVVLKQYDLFNDVHKHKLEKVLLAFGCIEENKLSYSLIPKIPENKAEKLLKGFIKEFKAWVEELYESYDDVIVPQEFIDGRKQQKLSKEILKTTISLRFGGLGGYKSRISIENILKFNGRIFYGSIDEEHIVQEGMNIFKAMFGSEHIDTASGSRNKFTSGKGIIFISCANCNLKYIKMSPNAYHIDLVYPILLRRKMINPANIEVAINFINRYDSLDGMYKGNFGKVNTKVVRYKNDIEKEIKELKKYELYASINFDNYLITKYVDKLTKPSINIRGDKKMDWLLKIEEDNKLFINWIELPYYGYDGILNFQNKSHDSLVELLKKVMVFN